LTIEQFKNFIRNSPWAIVLGYDSPNNDNLIEKAIDNVAQHFWNAYPWFFRFGSTTFSTASGTPNYEMEEDVDIIYEMTYADGDYTRYIKHRTGDDRAVKYNHAPQTGSVIREWDEYSYDNGLMTIRLSPTIDATYTVTIRYLRKYDNLGSIPDKFHPIIMAGIKGYITVGSLDDYMPYVAGIRTAKHQEKPYRIKKSAVEKDRIFKGELK